MLFVGALTACSGESTASECPVSLAQRIIGGQERLEGVAGDDLVGSLSRITFGNAQRGGLCTGLALSRSVVLTAAHCVRASQGAELLVEVPSATGELVGVVAKSWREHEWLDVALIDVTLPTLPLARSWRLATREDWIGVDARLTIAGFGVREDGGVGELRFVEEQVVGSRQKVS